MASDWRALRHLAVVAVEQSNHPTGHIASYSKDEKTLQRSHKHPNSGLNILQSGNSDTGFSNELQRFCSSKGSTCPEHVVGCTRETKAVNLEDPPLPSLVWPSEPTLYHHRRLQPSERFYDEMLFCPPHLPSILTVESWEPLIQDALSLSPEPVFQNADYRIQATDVALFRPLMRGDIINISDGGHKHIVLYTQKMDDTFAYIRVVSYTPSSHLESRPILVVRREMCDAPFPHQLRHEALAAIKNDPPFAFVEIRAWAASEPDL